jgi:hypothetical protein
MKKIITTTLLALIALNLNAATFLFDDLTTGYVDGNLVGQNGWAQTSTASNNPIQYFGSKVIVVSTGQDVWKSLSTQIVKANASTVFTRIDFSVVNAQATGDYFFSLSDPAGSSSNFYQRLFVRSSGSGLNLGLQSTSGTGAVTVWGSSVYSLNSLLSVVIAWDMVAGGLNDTFSLYVNPLTDDRSLLTTDITSNWNSTTGTEPASTISALNLRQGTSSTAPTTYVEELWVGDSLASVGIIPEPKTTTLLSLGLIALIGSRAYNRRFRER